LTRTKVLQLKIGLAFTAIVVGFLGAVAYVPFALWPPAQRAEAIHENYAESVRALSELRGQAREVRGAALLAYRAHGDPSVDREQQERAVAEGRERLRATAAQYARMPMSAEERASWRELLSSELPEFEEAIDAVLAASRRPGGDFAAARRLTARAATLDDALQGLADGNSAAAKAEAERIHQGLRRLSIGYVVLAVVGTAGAIVLLVQSLGLVRSYADATGRRMAELEAFAGQVSHDLRSPLQTIHLAVGSIERRAEDESVQRLAAKASLSVRRLDGMIRDLLHFARSGAGGRERAHADVGAVLAELRDELLPQAERAHVALTMLSDPSVLAGVAPVALKTILANLVENAIKYRRSEGENHVKVSAKKEGGRVQLVVEDGGIGIPADAVPHLFEPFFRGSKRPDSYGLGLATVKRLVDSHLGSITVQSEEGRGTTFVVTLPLATAPPASPSPAARRRTS
jgi:signal transduction histidine kinase